MKLQEFIDILNDDRSLYDPDLEKRERARWLRFATALLMAFFALVVALLILLGIVTSVVHDHLSSFFWRSGVVAAGFGAVLVLGAVIGWFGGGRRLPGWLRALDLLVSGVFFAATIGMLYAAIGAGLVQTYKWLSVPSMVPMTKALIGGIVTVVGGGLLFFFRLRLRSIYGATEALVGVVVGSQRVVDDITSTVDTSIAVLTAGIYLVVRGLDNVHTGLYDDKKADPLARRLYRRFMGIWDKVPEGRGSQEAAEPQRVR